MSVSPRVSRLYRKFGPLIYSRCRRWLGHDALAEEATEQVFVRAYRHLESAKDLETAIRRLDRITAHYCVGVRRELDPRPPAVSASVLP